MRQRTIIAALCGLLAASLTGRVAAKEAMVGRVGVQLVLPANFCELDSSQSPDAEFIARFTDQLAQHGAMMLSISAACSELPGWRSHASLLDHFVIFSADARFVNPLTPVDPETVRNQICSAIRANAKQAIASVVATLNSRPESIARGVKANGMAVVGVDDSDPNACYTAVLQNFRTQLGTEKLQLAIDSTLTIKGKILSSTVYSPYVDIAGVTGSLAENRNFVARWRAANGR